jgi:hypothetical protein
VKELRSAFEPINSVLVIRRKIRALKQEQSVQQYVYEFRNLVGQVQDMSEDDMISNFIEGLRDNVRLELHYRAPKSLDEAVKLAVSFDDARGKSIIDESKYYGVPLGSSSTPMELGNYQRSWNANGKNSGSGKSDKSGKQVRCFKCNGKGHYASKCPSRSKEETRGTNMSQRRETNMLVSQNEEDVEREINAAINLAEENKTVNEHRLIVLDGKIMNNIPVKALVDSGASSSFVDSAFIDKNMDTIGNVFIKEAGEPVIIVNGDHQMVSGKLKNIPLSFGNFVDSISLEAVRIANYDIILGKNWLFRHNPSID